MSNQKAKRVEIRVGPCDIMVLIRGLPHLILRRADLSGIESWQMSIGTRERYYFIQYTLRHGVITCDYDRGDLWREILSESAKAKVFDNMQGEAVR